ARRCLVQQCLDQPWLLARLAFLILQFLLNQRVLRIPTEPALPSRALRSTRIAQQLRVARVVPPAERAGAVRLRVLVVPEAWVELVAAGQLQELAVPARLQVQAASVEQRPRVPEPVEPLRVWALRQARAQGVPRALELQ